MVKVKVTVNKTIHEENLYFNNEEEARQYGAFQRRNFAKALKLDPMELFFLVEETTDLTADERLQRDANL